MRNQPTNLWAGIEAVLFDLDGVLTRTAARHRRAWYEMFSEHLPALGSSAPYAAEDYFADVDGKPRVEGVRSILASRGIDLPERSASDGAERLTMHGLGPRKDEYFRVHEGGRVGLPGQAAGTGVEPVDVSWRGCRAGRAVRPRGTYGRRRPFSERICGSGIGQRKIERGLALIY